MPKPRSRFQENTKPSIDDFIREPEPSVLKALDKNAPRKFKTISLPMNEYEYQTLAEACRKSGRSEKNLLRFAMIKYAKKLSE